MKPITCLITATVGLALTAPALAQVDCSETDWSTAEVSDVTRCLLAGADLNVRTNDGWTILHVTAGMNNNPAVIEALLNAGADLSARDANGQTPLHNAAGMNKNPAVIEALLNAGADLSARDANGQTPLHNAAGMNKNPAVIEALLNAGADLSARDANGWTPLDVATSFNADPAVIQALLAAGANTEARDEDGTSPISTYQNDTAESSNRHWVTSDRLNRRTCPSTDCGIVGQFFFREGTDVFEDKDGWARVSRYYDASCANGRSEYVDSGDSRCDPENGIVDGKFSEWVFADFLSEDRPPNPAADATGLEVLVAGSDDFQKYRGAFAQAAQSLISSGQCREADFREWGGWMKSVNDRSQPIYFIYCGGSKVSNRLYLNAETGDVFR